MKRIACCTLLVAWIAAGVTAQAQEAAKPPEAAPVAGKSEMKSDAMAMPKPGMETKALAEFFGMGGTWKGHVPAGAMGPGSPETTSHGKAICHGMLGGFWYVCDVQDIMGSGKSAMTWKGHMLVGYDMNDKVYKSTIADNTGAMSDFTGTLEGKKFTLETPNEITFMGQKMKDRLTWDMSEGKMQFTDEHKVGDGEWTMFESATMMPMHSGASKPMAAAKPEEKK